MNDNKCEYDKAFNKVLRLLSKKPRTEYELRSKMEQQDYDRIIIDQVLNRVKELGYVNDAEYSRMWIEQRRRVKPTGKRKLVMELCSKGIESNLVDEVMENSDLDDMETAIEILSKKFGTKEYDISNSNDYGRVCRYLMYRGVGYSTAHKAIKLFFDNKNDDYF